MVARDIAHAKLQVAHLHFILSIIRLYLIGRFQERIDAGQGLPEYIKNHIVYYGIVCVHLFYFVLLNNMHSCITAGPAKTPEGYASGSFGPTTAGAHPLVCSAITRTDRPLSSGRQGAWIPMWRAS